MFTPKFLFGSKAIFTITNPQGRHYTYKVFQSRKTKKETPHAFTVFIKKGDNLSYCGNINYYVNNNTTEFTVSNSGYKPEDEPIRVFEWAVKHVMTRKEFPKGYTMNHEGKCSCCGRELTVLESVNIGMGPICNNNKVNKNHSRTRFEQFIMTKLQEQDVRDIIDVYIGSSSDPLFSVCARVVFKSGEDVYTNIKDSTDEDIALIVKSIMSYRIESILN